LDSKLLGLEQYEGAPVEQIRGASRRALVNLVDLAVQEKVQFVLIGGDLYDGDWRDFNTGLFLINHATRLREAGIPLLMIAGNHDAANKMTRSLKLPENVKMFAAAQPETEILREIDVAIHGQSFAQAEVMQDLSAHYPPPIRGCFNLGLLHTGMEGREGHSRYAPCNLESLKAKGYDYWALGHIHQREIICEEPFVAFSGNIQGRHIRETGPKGCFLVTVDSSRQSFAKFVSLDVMRWARGIVNLGGVADTDEVLELAAERIRQLQGEAGNYPLAIRLEFQGACAAHRQLLAHRESWINEFRGVTIDASNGRAWLEKVQFQTVEYSAGAQPSIDESSLGELHELFGLIRREPQRLKDLVFDFSHASRKLPPELAHWRLDELPIPPDVIEEAESLLLDRLLHPVTPVRKGKTQR
jgi:DNA repair exonuclease SbcCD nuclease subunit